MSISSVCRRLGMSRQNYYAQRKRRPRQAEEADLITELVQRKREIQPRIGDRKLYKMLEHELAGVRIGRDRFFEVLREANLLLEPEPQQSTDKITKLFSGFDLRLEGPPQ